MPIASPSVRSSHGSSWALSFALLIGFGSSGFAGEEFVALEPIDVSGLDPVNSNPYGVALHPAAPLGWATLAGVPAFPFAENNGSTVVEFDLETLATGRTFTVELFPTDAVAAPDGSELYVVNSSSSSLSVVDLETETVEHFPLTDSRGAEVLFPSAVKLSPSGDRLWITSNGGSLDGSMENLLILDRESLELVDTVAIDGGLGRIAVNASGLVVVPVGYPGGSGTAAPEIRLYDASGGGKWKELDVLSLDVPTDDFPAPSDVVIAADGITAYVSVFGGSDEVFVVDLETYQLLDPIALGSGDSAQHGLALTADGRYLAVLEFFGDRVDIVDLSRGEVVASPATGALPTAIASHGGRLWITGQNGLDITVLALPGSYRRGDTNGDGALDIGDAITLLEHLFLDGALACADRGDVDDDGTLGVADAIVLLGYLFQEDAPPAYPYLAPGSDASPDQLPDCDG